MTQKSHPQYPLVEESQADGIAYAFNGPDQPAVRYPFKFPAIKPHEIRIKQTYFGLCYTDCHLVQQEWFDVQYPIVPGHEILGRVTIVGADVKNFKVGDLVGFGFIRNSCGKCELCYQGDDHLCGCDEHLMPGLPNFGGFADHVQAPAHWAFPIPASIPEEVCAPLMCAGVTVFAPLKKHGKVGFECGIIGVGGLGHMAIKYASAMGMKTTVISTSANKKEESFSYGATDFILFSNEEDLKKNEKRFDIILNTAHTGSSEQFGKYLNLVKSGGSLIQIGIPHKDSDIGVCYNDLVSNQRSIVGSLVASRLDNFEMLEFSAKHKLYPVVEVFPFAEFNKAYDHLHKGQPKYRCVVKI